MNFFLNILNLRYLGSSKGRCQRGNCMYRYDTCKNLQQRSNTLTAAIIVMSFTDLHTIFHTIPCAFCSIFLPLFLLLCLLLLCQAVLLWTHSLISFSENFWFAVANLWVFQCYSTPHSFQSPINFVILVEFQEGGEIHECHQFEHEARNSELSWYSAFQEVQKSCLKAN